MKLRLAALLLVLVTPCITFAAPAPIRVDLALITNGDPAPLRTSVICQDGKSVESRAGGVVFRVTSAHAEGIITTEVVIVPAAAQGTAAANEIRFPTLKSLPDQRAVIGIGDHTLDVTASVVRGTVFSFDFAGGTLGQFLASIANGSNPPLNLITTNDQLTIPLPAFSMRSAGIGALVESLDRMVRPQGMKITETKRNVALVRREYVETDPVFLLEAREQKSADATAQTHFDCLPLEPLLDRYTPEAVAESIQTAWALDTTRRPPALKYHPATKLLFVVGSDPASVAVARQIYATLLDSETGKSGRMTRVADEIRRRREARAVTKTEPDEAPAPSEATPEPAATP